MNHTSFDSLLGILSDLFTQNGFKKKGLIFAKKNEHYWFIVHWQKSKDFPQGSVKFTINIGIHNLRLAEIEDESLKKVPDIWSCHYRLRIGYLLPEQCDKWWQLPDNFLAPSVIEEFRQLINQTICPFFNKFDAPDVIIDLWKSGVSPGQTEVMRLEFLKLLGER